MNHSKIIAVTIGIFAISFSFAQTVEQDFSHLDKNKDGKIDKSEFQNPPPPPPAPKQKSTGGATPSSQKSDAVGDNEERAMKKEDTSQKDKMDHPTFESIDTNGDGIIDMNEFKLNHTIVRKRPGATKN